MDQIRKEASTICLQDLQKLRERLGSKLYNKAMFGHHRIKEKNFKKTNKSRPQEMSSKLQVPRFKEVISVKKQAFIRDPRYDSLCGTYNEQAFRNSYKFLNGIMENDLKLLRDELNKTEDPKLIRKIRYLIQRLENQQREKKKRENMERTETQEWKEKIKTLRCGERPAFKRKHEKRVRDLVSQYEELKVSGKLKKHIDRFRKKNVGKDRKKFTAQDIE